MKLLTFMISFCMQMLTEKPMEKLNLSNGSKKENRPEELPPLQAPEPIPSPKGTPKRGKGRVNEISYL